MVFAASDTISHLINFSNLLYYLTGDAAHSASLSALKSVTLKIGT